jgi:pimeloyl-ACP methyl ester carboxylesterase
MNGPCSRYVTLLDREIHYMEWGERGRRPLIMWHGLARTGRDFDDIAVELASEYHIVVPDTIGRGLSQWSPQPEKEYCYDFYAALAKALLDEVGFDKVDWIGTSMGGATAIRAAAGPLKGRIKRLVINDIGPEVASAAVERIRSYAGKPPRFDKVTELEAYFRTIYKPYGYQTDAQWRRMTETSVRRLPDGGITTHYDPNMVMQFTHHPEDNLQWAQWGTLDCEVLCLRGADSDLLTKEIAARMQASGPRCRVLEIQGCGHAPCLNVPEQIGPVREFLKNGL